MSGEIIVVLVESAEEEVRVFERVSRGTGLKLIAEVKRLQSQLDAIPDKVKIMSDLFPNRLNELIDELTDKS